MQFKFRLPLAILATVFVSVSSVHAQDDDEDEEEFGTMGFYSRSPSSVSMALKMTDGPKVSFGNLGTISRSIDFSNGANVGRVYDDGKVNADALRPAGGAYEPELSGTGDPAVTNIDGRYKVYEPGTTPGTDTLLGDYLSYRKGRTRSWEYSDASQISAAKPGYVAFNIYSTRTQGATVEATRGYTGGVELSMARSLKSSKRFVLSLNASLSLTGINSSKRGDVTSTLYTYRDYYLYYPYTGTGAPALPNDTEGTSPFKGPSFTEDPVDGHIIETTTPISQNPDEEDHDDPKKTSNIVVHGRWKIRGAYFTLKVGPQVTAMITRSIGVTAGLGLAGSYAGTTYSSEEYFEAPVVETNISTSELSDDKNMLLAGYYANIDATWALNDRTGLFAGVSYDNLGEYSQSVAGRTAKIDLSSTSGIRGGLNIKF